MSGLLFKSSTALHGNINIQPKQTPATLNLMSVALTSIASSSPKLSTLAFNDILKIHLETNTVPTLTLSSFPPSSIPRILSTPSYPAILPIFPSTNREPHQSKQSDDRLASKQNRPNPNFTPLESLTGVSTVRPELLLATGFEPVFYDGSQQSQRFYERKTDQTYSGLNPYGEFIDAQIQVNHLRHEAIGKLLSELKQKDADFKSQLDNQENQFHFHIDNLRAHSNYLRDVVSQLTNLKATFDIRANQFPVDFQRVAYDYFQDSRQQLLTNLEERFEANVSYQTVLNQLGFTLKNVRGFSNTKTYFQTLYEFLNLLKGYSNNLLGINIIEQRDDANPTYINKHKVNDFSSVVTNTTGPTFDFLTNLRKIDVLSITDEVKGKFDKLFGSLHLANDESKVSLLLTYLSKEYTFSNALGSAQVRDYIKDSFGYPVSFDFSNASMFDVVVGNIGEKVTDVVNGFSVNSLATIGQQVFGNVAVLPFETSYVSYENSTFTPGSVFLVDKLLDVSSTDQAYNTNNLDAYVDIVDAQLGRLSTLSRYLGLAPQIYTQDKTFFATAMKDPNVLFDNIVQDYLDTTDYSLKKNMDSDVVAIFNKAQNDNRLKSLLFLYVFSRTFGVSNSNSTQTLDTLVKEITRNVGANLTQDKRSINDLLRRRFAPTDTVDHGTTSSESLEHVLNTSNDFLSTFFNQFRRIFDAFSAGLTTNSALERFTIYSHTQRTTLLMVIFELLLSTVNKYVKKVFIGRFLTRSPASIGKEFFSTRTSFASNSISVQTVKSKLAFESNIRIRTLFVLLSSMQVIRDSSKNTVNQLRDPDHVKRLNEILAIVGDRDTLQLVMNDQQIHLIETTVEDVAGKLSNVAFTTGRASTGGSISSEEDVQLSLGNNQDDVKILDDSLVGTELKNVLFSYLAQDKYTAKDAANTRLLSIGVPLGFSQNLRQSVKVTNVNAKNFEPKQTDVVRLNVFKVDVEHQDLVFKPVSYLFELNRYVVKDDTKYRWTRFGATFNEVLNAIPTRDFSMVDGVLKQRVSYLSDSQAPLFVSPEYDFLTLDQKKELLGNHVSSYLLELYVRMLTGMRASEHDFLTHPDNVKQENVAPFIVSKMIDARVSKLLGPTKNAFASKTFLPFAKEQKLPLVNNKLVVQLPQFPLHVQYNLSHSLVLLHSFRRMRTQYSDNDNESRRIFTPKTFERVFTVAANPNDFEIDTVETLKTPSGRDAFDKLLHQGRIVGDAQHSTFYPGVNIDMGTYRLVSRDKNVGDLVFEKYFVSLETVLDTEI
jgi:hypothetical protein